MRLKAIFHIYIIAFCFCLDVFYGKAFADTNAAVSQIVGTQLSQQQTASESFARIDNFMSLPQKTRMLMRYENKYAYTGAGQQVFSPTFIPDEKAGIWAKSYNLFENVAINNGPNDSNVAYGTIVGYDTHLKHLKHNYDYGFTYHVAYAGSRENYNGEKSISDFGDVGVTGALFKNNFFTAVTLDAGDSYTRETKGPDFEHYNTFIAGLAWKTGYNIEFNKGKYILQPSFLGTYNYDNIGDFKSYKGKNIHIDPINAVQIIPGVKLIGNFESGWQPYLSLSVVWDLMDSPAVYEEGNLRQRMSLAPYCEYGFGIQKKYKDKYTTFGQVMMRGGGRNGVSLYLGLRYALGK